MWLTEQIYNRIRILSGFYLGTICAQFRFVIGNVQLRKSMDIVGVRLTRLNDKIAFIAGTGMGIGRATSLLLAREGVRIIAADIDKKDGDESVAFIKSQGGMGILI